MVFLSGSLGVSQNMNMTGTVALPERQKSLILDLFA
jgi:hypothetical protein